MSRIDWVHLGFDFGNWDEKKVWEIDLPAVEMDIKDLLWHFDMPYWTNDKKEKFSVTPWNVINKKPGTKQEQLRVECADLSYPIDILKHNDRWIILDGVHRLVKTYQAGETKIKVRIFPKARLGEIIIEEPFKS